MLTELCAELKNWFVKDESDKHFDTFTISGGVLTPSLDIKNNQYYRIIGSLYNDGVHKKGDTLTDETFEGAVWLMHVPGDVISLANSIQSYETANGTPSPYVSESFGGYSYSKATGSNGAVIGWEKAFADKLKRYRKL